MSNENEWFARHEVELLRQARRQRARREQESERQLAEERRNVHWMKCPKCGSDLQEVRLGEVAVDRCEPCGGVFLDRGELEQLMAADQAARKGFFRRLLGFSD